ncbi:MAG: hypothetical protein ACOCRN_04630, partial [Spirochaetia bacterium]
MTSNSIGDDTGKGPPDDVRNLLNRDRQEARQELLEDILPFWLANGMDQTYGGLLTGCDRSGALVESDKSMWFQGRFAWILSTAYVDLSPS